VTYRRVAVISDIHGNAPALEAVLAEIATLDVDLIVSCGDLLAGPMPRETAALVAGLGDGIRHVRGNTDREVADVYDGASAEHAGAAHAAAAIGPEERALLDTFEPTVLITVDGLGEVCCCHATHSDDETILTYLTSDERLATTCRSTDASAASVT
jgi:predicted phosphodiesterase